MLKSLFSKTKQKQQNTMSQTQSRDQAMAHLQRLQLLILAFYEEELATLMTQLEANEQPFLDGDLL